MRVTGIRYTWLFAVWALAAAACTEAGVAPADQKEKEEAESDTLLIAGEAVPYLDLSMPWGYKVSSSCATLSCQISGWLRVKNTAAVPAVWWSAAGDRFHFVLVDESGNVVNKWSWSGSVGTMRLLPGQDTVFYRQQAGMQPGGYRMPAEADTGYYGLRAVIDLDVPEGMEGEYGEVELDLGQVWWPFGEGPESGG